ncbi:hypothetical protein FA95DRAFT_1506217, partial [Auriscalpium vulgare]
LQDWLPFREVFIQELLRLEGLGEGDTLSSCANPTCESGEHGYVKCVDCTGGVLMCRACTVKAHISSPFHRLQRWTGSFFDKYSLREAGLRIQLGHDGHACPLPLKKDSSLTVVDISGVHEIQVDYCDCARIGSSRHFVQLLRASLWPATVERPQTAITLRALKTFHALTLQGKINAYDFWCGLERLTDGLGTQKIRYRYKEFLRAIRCFRNVRMLKRAGRCHDAAGVDATAPGELVVECPLCPHPGRNMPEGWEAAPEDEKWKHAAYLAIDANFKLKMKNRGVKDIELSPGWGYFVKQSDYGVHVGKYADEKEMKYCDSNHSAVDHANTPALKRFSINGVGAVICSRHCYYLRHAIGDLAKGERYSCMDYMLLGALKLSLPGVKKLFISYDIACSFSRNFAFRMARYPQALGVFDSLDINWAVPKFHLVAHGPKCQEEFSYNEMFGVGRTHGESIESGWADLNPVALSTREMGGPQRHESLDDILGAFNWRKTIKLGTRSRGLDNECADNVSGLALKKSLKAAHLALATHKPKFDEMSQHIPIALREQWFEMMRVYDSNKKAPNPYKEPNAVTTLADVRLELADEEAVEAARGHLSPHETTASVFIHVGLDIEEQQQKKLPKPAEDDDADKNDGKRKRKILTNDVIAYKEKQNALRRRITSWRQIQLLYIPCIAQLLPTSAPDSSGDDTILKVGAPEVETLFLPSQIPPELRGSGCVPGLVDKERRLRLGQAQDALHQLRRAIRIKHGMVHYKRVHVDGPGQNANTRARTQLQQLEEKTQRHVERYRAAHDALMILDPDGNWKSQLLVLKNEDIRPARIERDKLGKGNFEVSWIWQTLRADARDIPGAVAEEATEDEVNDSVRVDWATSRARIDRWVEEIELLKEEMPRAVRFMRGRANWWRSRASARSDLSTDMLAGLRAYAFRQAAHHDELADSYIALWRPVLLEFGHADLWAEDVSPSAPAAPAPDGPHRIPEEDDMSDASSESSQSSQSSQSSADQS